MKKKIIDEQNTEEFKKIQHEKEILNMRMKNLSEEVEIIKQEKEEALEIMRNTLRVKNQEDSQAVEENKKLKEKLEDLKEDLEILTLSKKGTDQANVLLFCLEAVDINIPNVMKTIYNPRHPFALSEEREELKTKMHHTQNLISTALKELGKIKNNTIQYHPADSDTEEGLGDD